MAVTFLIGPPGAGKSYEATVYHVLPALQQGRKVITNLPLNVEAFAKLDATFPSLIDVVEPSKGNLRPFSELGHYESEWRHPEHGYGPLYVIDECHLPLPRGGTRPDVEEWYSLHRHEGADLILMTQSYGKVSKAICDLVQTVIVLRKNSNLGSRRSYRREVRDGLTRASRIGNPSIRHYKKEYFPLYQSYTRGGKGEADTSDLKPLWRRWEFYGAAAVLAYVAYQGIFGSGLLPSSLRGGKSVPVAETAQAVAAGGPSSGAATARAGHSPYRQLAIIGFLELGPEKMPVFRAARGVGRTSAFTTVTGGELRRQGFNVTVLGPCSVRYEYRGDAGEAACE